MFSGIIETTGFVESIQKKPHGLRLRIRAAKRLCGISKGESIAVNGVCLTALGRGGRSLSFDVMGETLRQSNLSLVKKSDPVNLERALKYGQRISGHYVLGHVEFKGILLRIRRRPKDGRFSVSYPRRMKKYLVLRGSVSVDGISLTIARVTPNAFEICIIPHTWTHTNLRFKAKGDPLNVETDILLKAGRPVR